MLAIQRYESALEILEDLHGKDSVKLIPVYQGMGLVNQELFGNFIER